MSTLAFYFVLYRTALKSVAEYRVDLAVGVVTAISMQLAALAFYWVIFTRAPLLGGWTPAEVLLLFGFTALVLGSAEATLNGIWSLPYYIIDGQLDRLLTYPVNSLAFVLLSRPELHSLGNLTAGALSFGVAFALIGPPWYALLLLPLWIASGAVIYTGVLVLVGALTFRIVGPQHGHLFTVHQLFNTSRYPSSIYPRWLHVLVLYVLPFGAAIFWPADWLRGHGSLVRAVLVPPVAACLTAVAAKRAWDAALRGYQSTGS
jgi:ABC-2 type transport system permease protein